MGVTSAVVSFFLLVWENMVGAGGLKYADPAICIREKPAVIFELEQVACQRQIFLVSKCTYFLSLQLLLKWKCTSHYSPNSLLIAITQKSPLELCELRA
jgi:hypothetical protein